MNYLPNIITLTRIISALYLYFINPITVAFLIIYIYCGISDMLDGYLARRLNITSDFGTRLDSIADFVFIVVTLIKLIPIIELPQRLIVGILLIFIIKIIAILIGYYKNHELIMLHTYANKLMGFVLFCFPVFWYFNIMELNIGILILGFYSSIEELVIIIIAQNIDCNIKSFMEINL